MSASEPARLSLCQSATYEIRVQGLLSDCWEDCFDGIHLLRDDGQGITIFRGNLNDQSALHGLLRRIESMALPLLSVECVEVLA